MSTNEIDRILSLPVDDRAAALTAFPEDQWFERKSIRIAPKDFALPLVALANAEGGTIIVGVHRGEVEGVRRHVPRVNALMQVPLDLTRPPVRAHFEQVPCRNSRGEIDEVLVARVSPGDVVHETSNGDCFLRVGDESRRLGFTQRQELHYDRGSAPYDGHPLTGVGVDDLDSAALRT